MTMASQCFHHLPHHYVTWTINLARTIYPRVHHIHPTRASRPMFILCDSTITPSHKSISFCLHSWTCVLDFSLLRGASGLSILCTQITVCLCPVCGCTHSDSPSPLLTLPSPASCRLTGHRPVHAALLCTYRSAKPTSALRLRHVIGLPSSLRCVLMHYLFNDPSKGEYPGARVGSGVVGRRRGVSLAEELSVIHCVRLHLHLLRRLTCCSLPMHMVVVYRIYSIVL